MTTTALAPGKVILLGEHAAVYGNPVLVAAVDLRCCVTVKQRRDDVLILDNPAVGLENYRFNLPQIPRLKKKWNLALSCESIEKTMGFLGEHTGLEIKIESDIPISSGLGSSASIASAMVLAIAGELGHDLARKEIAEVAWDIENIIHGKSSGVDPFAVTFGGVGRYSRGRFKEIKIKEYPKITIGDSGIRSDTGELVSDVMRLKKEYPRFFDLYLEMMDHIVDYGQRFLGEGDLERFGQVMNINHGLLSSIGVSCPELDKLVWAARKKSLGAKLCGAGGGGIMLALGDVGEDITKAGGKVIKTRISEHGVRLKS